jgi:hypothetical protein
MRPVEVQRQPRESPTRHHELRQGCLLNRDRLQGMKARGARRVDMLRSGRLYVGLQPRMAGARQGPGTSELCVQQGERVPGVRLYSAHQRKQQNP